MKSAKVDHSLSVHDLVGMRIGSSAEEKLQWFLSFVNQGEWRRIEEAPGLSILQFEPPKLALKQYEWDQLVEELETFCGIEIGERRLERTEVALLQDLAARILSAMANKGVIMEDLSGCKIVVFADHTNQRISTNLTGDRRTRFLLEVKRIFEGLDLRRLRACPGCLRLFYTERRQRFCVPEGTCSNRVRQKRHKAFLRKTRRNRVSRKRRQSDR
jgi:hypothetical protein